MHQPLQLLSLLRPDITHFWQAELDTRYTGHHYSLFETASTWSTATPRRLLWERNKRYYFPTVHGPWHEYNDFIANMSLNGGIWGPVKTRGTAPPVGPTPPFREPELDVDYQWGVGEDADLLALAPAFEVTDIKANTFMYNEHKLGYPDGMATPAFAVGTVPLMRFSQRLLRAMHHGQMTRGFDMMPEMYPQSTALHHGLKLVSFPLPVYVDMAVIPRELEEDFSADEGATMLNSPYEFREVWRRMTYWHTMDGLQLDHGYVRQLWDRWTGREYRWQGEEPERMCLPQMLLHPIKEG